MRTLEELRATLAQKTAEADALSEEVDTLLARQDALRVQIQEVDARLKVLCGEAWGGSGLAGRAREEARALQSELWDEENLAPFTVKEHRLVVLYASSVDIECRTVGGWIGGAHSCVTLTKQGGVLRIDGSTPSVADINLCVPKTELDAALKAYRVQKKANYAGRPWR